MKISFSVETDKGFLGIRSPPLKLPLVGTGGFLEYKIHRV